jgi:predicted lipoprotein with Yx(FWY)xxD motif
MTLRAARKLAVAAAALLTVCGGAPAWAAFDATLPYPAEVALSEVGDKGYVYVRFPGAQRLYTYDLDRAGRSFCNEGCATARPPILAPAGSKPMGDWTVIRRDNGLLQWAYRGSPVYSMFHDAPNSPRGDGEGGVWHLVPIEK